MSEGEYYPKWKIQVQLFMVVLSLIFCVSIFIEILRFGCKKDLWISREKERKQIIHVFLVSLVYVGLSILADSIELGYRFILPKSLCGSFDQIQEWVICVTRSVLLISYVVLINQVFNDGSSYKKYKIKKSFIGGFYATIFIVHMILLPLIYIPFTEPIPKQTNGYGVYCFNNLIPPSVEFWGVSNIAKKGVIAYQTTDAFIACALCVVFAFKLRQISIDLTEKDDQKRAALKKLIFYSLMLTLFSVISSWIIIFIGRLDEDTWWRWIYPLDYIPNCLCIYLWLRLMYNDNNGQKISCCLTFHVKANQREIDDGEMTTGDATIPINFGTETSYPYDHNGSSNIGDSKIDDSHKKKKAEQSSLITPNETTNTHITTSTVGLCSNNHSDNVGTEMSSLMSFSNEHNESNDYGGPNIDDSQK